MCNKKLVDQGNGMWRCEKCSREFPNYKWRMILQVSAWFSRWACDSPGEHMILQVSAWSTLQALLSGPLPANLSLIGYSTERVFLFSIQRSTGITPVRLALSLSHWKVTPFLHTKVNQNHPCKAYSLIILCRICEKFESKDQGSGICS